MPQKVGKHTPYFELLDAQGQAGCPICRLVDKATERYLDSILYEAVLDPEVRAKLKAARGFCARHVEMLRHMPGRALGIALIYRDIIRAMATALDGKQVAPAAPSPLGRLVQRLCGARAAQPLIASQDCPACTIGRGAEEDYLFLLLAHLDDPALQAAYAAGDGLCLEHLAQALPLVEDAATLRRLAQPQLVRYKAMLGDLDEFIRKRDHRFSHEKYGEEGDVWLRAMNAVVGGAGRGLSAKHGGRGKE